MEPNLKLKYLATSVLACSILLPGLAKPQATGSITGTVTDPVGSIVAGAAVTITNVNTNESRVVTTNNDGRFTANLLPIGNYKIQVTATSFQNAIRNGI